jgi:hypothetical protein
MFQSVNKILTIKVNGNEVARVFENRFGTGDEISKACSIKTVRWDDSGDLAMKDLLRPAEVSRTTTNHTRRC